jgi:hypothetical protein
MGTGQNGILIYIDRRPQKAALGKVGGFVEQMDTSDSISVTNAGTNHPNIGNLMVIA